MLGCHYYKWYFYGHIWSVFLHWAHTMGCKIYISTSRQTDIWLSSNLQLYQNNIYIILRVYWFMFFIILVEMFLVILIFISLQNLRHKIHSWGSFCPMSFGNLRYLTTTIYIKFILNIHNVRLTTLEKIIPWMNTLFVMAN